MNHYQMDLIGTTILISVEFLVVDFVLILILKR